MRARAGFIILLSGAEAWSPMVPASLAWRLPTSAALPSPTRTEQPLGFINGEMRPYAMKLHTREQAPREGQASPKPESKPMAAWRYILRSANND